MRLGYMVSRFPDYSEGFVRYEIGEISRLMDSVRVFALVKSDARGQEPLLPGDAERPYCLARPPGLFSARAASAVVSRGLRQPRALASAWLTVFGHLASAPAEVLKWLVLFPRMLSFGLQARQAGIGHIHAHFAALPAAAAWTINRLFSIPYSVTAHAYDLAGPAALLRLKMSGALFGAAETRLAATQAAEAAPEHGAFKWHVLRNGVPLDVFRPGPKQGNPAVPRIVSVGRLVPKKGFPVLLEALSLLRAKGVAMECRIIGEGVMRGVLEKQIGDLGLGDVVVLPGVRLGKDLLGEYQAADMFALPCLDLGRGGSDMLPVALIEAMAMGLPVVGCRVASVPELVIDGENGLLVPCSDAAALAAAMERLAGSAGLRARLGAAARRAVCAAHDVRQTAPRLAELIFAAHRGENGT